MPATALIKFVQGFSAPPAGEALIGPTGVPVTASNGDNSGVATWEWVTVDKPPGSTAIPSGVITTASSFVFTPDLAGGYHLQLKVRDIDGIESVDRRVFQVAEPSGHVIPPFDALAPALNFSAQTRGWAKYLEELLRFLLAGSGGGGGAIVAADFSFVAGDKDTDQTTFTRTGARRIDLTNFPATVGSLTRQVRFKVVIENILHSAIYNAEIRLYDVDGAVAITGSTLDNSAAPDRALPTELSSGLLTVGTSPGNIRSDFPLRVYEAQLRGVGVLTPPTDRVIVSSARLEVLYV